MENAKTTKQGLTRGDKAHKKFMDKVDVVKETVMRGIDATPKIQKQANDSFNEYVENIKNSHKLEIEYNYEIIKTSENEKERAMARARIKEIDHIIEEEIKNGASFFRDGGNEANANVLMYVFFIAGVAGLFIVKNKEVRQIARKAFVTAGELGNNLLC